MQNLFLINENIVNGFHSINLEIITITSIICGIFVIVSKNPIVSVLYLIGLFLSISVYLMLQGLSFIGLSYLLVYVGAVSILFLFILMLINVRISEIVSSTSNSIPLGIIVGTILYTVVSKALPNTLGLSSSLNSIALAPGIRDLVLLADRTEETLEHASRNIMDILKITPGFTSKGDILYDNVMSQTWDGLLSNFSHINIIGNVIYTSYSLWLLLTSLILLLAMVGTIVITIKN